MIQVTSIFPNMLVKEEKLSNLIDQEITNRRLVCITRVIKAIRVAEVSTDEGTIVALEIAKVVLHAAREIHIDQKLAE
jgi:hypothetical protein